MKPLLVNKHLFAALDDARVLYCHWKSNRRLDQAISGEDDLDLLVASADRELFDQIVREAGFINLLTPRLRTLPDIEDRLGFDAATGRLSHLHVHHRLVLGEKRVKHHRLPIEEWLLADCRRLGGMPVPAPEKELFVLYIRAILKSDPRAALRTILRRRAYAVPEEIFDEAQWLLAHSDDVRLQDAPESAGLAFLADGFAEFISRVQRDELSPGYVVREKRALLGKLRGYQRYPTAIGVVRKVWFRLRYSRPSRKIAPVPRKRLDHPGVFLAVVGADGSGKTTLVSDLTEWMGWKVETRHVFFGLPKRSPFLLAIRKARKGAVSIERNREPASRSAPLISGVAEYLRTVEWLYAVIGRVVRESLAKRARDAGEIVIAERYPLPDIVEAMEVPMDGPRIRGTSGLHGLAAARERRLYGRIGAADPIYLLDVDVEVLYDRRPDDDRAWLASKAAAVGRAVATGRYESVAADRPYEEVLIDLKRRIWQLL